MNTSFGKSINVFLRNEDDGENTRKIIKKDFHYENKEKLNFRKSLNYASSYGKRHKKAILKNYKGNIDDSFSDNENSASGASISLFPKKNFSGKRYNLNCKTNSNKGVKNIIANKLTPIKNNEVDKLDRNYNTDNYNYFKYRRKECKSSKFGASKKKNNIYKAIKRNNILNKKKDSIIQNTYNINNLNIYNSLNANENSKRNKNKENVFKIQEYKRKNIFNNNKIINKNYLKGNHNVYLFSEENSLLNQDQKTSRIPNMNLINKGQSKNNLNLINTSYSSFHQDTDEPKRKSLFLNLPSIKSDDIQKSLNIKTERKERPVIPISKLFSKTKKNMKEEIKKTTTINIYNNKINNINNIILNEKNQIYDNKREENNFSSVLFDTNNLENKDSKNKDKIKEKLYEGLKNNKNSEDISIPISSSKEKIFKINRNKQRKVKTTILGIKTNNKKYRSKAKYKNTRLIEKLPFNYKNKCLSKLNMFRHKGENIDKVEIDIRQKVLYAFSLKNNSKFINNLNKTKKETTIKLFEKLTKKICNDIEEESEHYKQKEKINFSQNVMINIEKDYIYKINKQSTKSIKKLNKFIYQWKNLLIQIYKINISEYTKITPDRNKYFFFKYIFDYYFIYIEKIISLDTNYHKKFKNYNLSNIYHKYINKNSISFCNSVYKRKENYFHSLFLQNLFMEKDKIQNFSTNERNIEKLINQINSLIQQAKVEISDMRKTGDVKLDFIVEEKEEDNENGKGEQEINPKNHINNIMKKIDTKKLTFLNIQKSESDTDKYDSKNEKKNLLCGKFNFNYKLKNSFNDKDKNLLGNIDINSKYINISTKSHSLLSKKKTFNNDYFHSHYSNKLNTNSINIDCKSLDNKKEELESKYNISLNNREKIERKYDKIITQNKDYFSKRRKMIKTKKKEKNNEIKKNEINFLKGSYMFKNMIDYRTDEIKLNIKNNIKSPVEMLFYHIKEHDFDEFVELFERKQIELNSRNRDNDSFLIYAVKCKAMKFVLYLLKRGIDVNMENKLGNTALHYAFSDQNFQLADVLLKHGADEFRTNAFGKTPWECLGKKNI